MISRILSLLIATFLFLGCKSKQGKVEVVKSKQEKVEVVKSELLFAENKYFLNKSIRFGFYSDSSYRFTIIEGMTGHEKVKEFSGSCTALKDTIYFQPLEFNYSESDKAVLKNDFIEFINGNYPFRMEIKRNKIKTNYRLNFSNYNDYAIFTYVPKFNFYFTGSYKTTNVRPYDINQTELKEIDILVRKCLTDNSSNLLSYSDYNKQCFAVINSNQEVEVWVACHCKDVMKNEYKYSLLQIKDGGYCNISFKINLTKKTYFDLMIAGVA